MPDDSNATVASRPLPYRDGQAQLEGVLHWPEAVQTHASILLIHGGAGLDNHAREQAVRFAALGYTVLACDMYGDLAGSRERIMVALKEWRANPSGLVGRGIAGLTALADAPESVA